MREFPKSVFGICTVAVAVMIFTAGIVKVCWDELFVQFLSEAAGSLSSSEATEFGSSAAAVAVGYLLVAGWSAAAALAWALVHGFLAGRLVLGEVAPPKALPDGPLNEFLEKLHEIEVDFTGLGSEIHREHATTLADWKRSVEHYVRLCLYFEKSAINALTESISIQRDLRDSIDLARSLVTKGLAETILILEKPSAKEDYRALFHQAAEQVWSIARHTRCLAEQLSSPE